MARDRESEDKMSDTENKPQSETETPEDETVNSATAAGSDSETEAEVELDPVLKLTAELDSMRDKLMRALAEADNARKRATRDVADARSYAVSSFAKDMLDVSDNLARAMASADEAALADVPDSVKNLVEGVAMTEKALISKMERHGVKKVDPQPGDTFDPHKHQAVAQIPSDHGAGKIANVMQTGFVIADRTLRAAMVAVSSGPAAGDGDASGGSGGNVDVKA
ncbi:nucleotide exchange factor GrpE [Maricaulis sp.]|jgi:molecular chaperone GrpE|uniref:nucleotide exchange factor GrpE n=1 Tax=Maricaulis sp. TaxID=1486257 RepID=UPI002624EF8A|nr:nucleotide exchange factor GrpE [Maricaulis sp.]MDF1767641.1 nucleotide exchange factor GrpE [Maricaulis sp.]